MKRCLALACLFVTLCLAASLPFAVAEEDPVPLRPADEEPEGESKQPEIVTLREAAVRGDLDVEGYEPTSYRRVKLRLRNTSGGPLAVDLCGSSLTPRRSGSCQRLGIGPPVTPRTSRPSQPSGRRPRPGTVVIDLKAGQEVRIEVNTCCLDAGRSAPRKQVFRAARSRLPAVREKVLRWWADHPETPQSAVNSAIWQFRDEIVTQHPQAGVYRGPTSKSVAAHRSTHFLVRGGELLSQDPDGIERFLGTDIYAVHPTDSAIFAVALGASPREGQVGQVELWRHVETGEEPWRRVTRLPPSLRVTDILVGPRGHILLLGDAGLYQVDARQGRIHELLKTKDSANLSVRFRKDGSADVTHRRPADAGYYQGGERKGAKMPVCELWRLDLVNNTRERQDEFWNVAQVRVGEAGLFGLTPGGKLRRWQGRSFKNISGQFEYERILHVGRRYLWLESRNGRLVATDAAGRLRFEAGPALSRIGHLEWDAHTDEGVYVDGREFKVIEPAKGKRRVVAPADYERDER